MPPLSNGLRPPPTHHPARRAASPSQRHFCARQAGAAIHRSTDEQDPGSGNYRGVFGAENAVFTLRRKDERRLPRPGVQLPRGRIRGKMSSMLYIFFRLTVERSAALL